MPHTSKRSVEDCDLKQRIQVVVADITTLEVDAIVNAANCSLLGGGGVDGAIHRRAGPQLTEACARLLGCSVGEAKLTLGYRLPAAYVIHTVGPTYVRNQKKRRTCNTTANESLLALAYLNSLAIARDMHMRTVAFPSLSTGSFGYPINEAAPIAVKTVASHLLQFEYPKQVLLVAYCDRDFLIIEQSFNALLEQMDLHKERQHGI